MGDRGQRRISGILPKRGHLASKNASNIGLDFIFIRRKIIPLLAILLCFIIVDAFADEIYYFYDNSGRLIRAVRGVESYTYVYDGVGNLLRIEAGAAGVNAPVISSVEPDLLVKGAAQVIKLKGGNFITARSVTSDKTELGLKIVSNSDTEISMEVTVPPDIADGAVNFTVSTVYGSASKQSQISQSSLSFVPGSIVLFPGATGGLTAAVSPPASKDITISVNNSAPAVISAPALLPIVANSSAGIITTPLQQGTAELSSGAAKAAISVVGSSMASSIPVSVYRVQETGSTANALSLPVSVYMEITVGESVIVSPPVSAQISP